MKAQKEIVKDDKCFDCERNKVCLTATTKKDGIKIVGCRRYKKIKKEEEK